MFLKIFPPGNLSILQVWAFHNLFQDTQFVVLQMDRKLGPAVIEKATYIYQVFLDYLLDTTTYKNIPP